MPTTTPEQRLQRAWKIYQIYERFIDTAKMIGKTIIAEVGTHKKTISLSKAGGVGGGGTEPLAKTWQLTIRLPEKYCTRGIFFKFVRDVYGIYGGDHFSMKAAGELYRLICFTDLNVMGRIRPRNQVHECATRL